MDITLILKLTGLGILITTAGQILKKSGHEEQATFVAVAGIAMGIIMTADKIKEAVELIRSVFSL